MLTGRRTLAVLGLGFLVCDSDEETDKEGRVIKECHDNDSERM